MEIYLVSMRQEKLMSMEFPQKLWNNTLYAYSTLYFSDTICKYCTQKKKKSKWNIYDYNYSEIWYVV